MVVLLLQVKVKPGKRERFLEVIRHDATHSEHDEAGCLRFDVLQDSEDPDTFFYYEVYKDDAARAAHRETPHFGAYAKESPELLDVVFRRITHNVHPQDSAWR